MLAFVPQLCQWPGFAAEVMVSQPELVGSLWAVVTTTRFKMYQAATTTQPRVLQYLLLLGHNVVQRQSRDLLAKTWDAVMMQALSVALAVTIH